MFGVARGVEPRPVANDAHLLRIERSDTPNTGDPDRSVAMCDRVVRHVMTGCFA
jgi:hypothetical protein